MNEVEIILKAVDKASGEINKVTTAGGKLSGAFKSLTGVSLGTAGAVGLLTKGLQFSINEAIQSEQATMKLNQVLKSTQGVAGMTMDSLEGLATSLSKVTTYDDDTIKSAEALMLTFTKVSKDVFPDAIEAAMNMSAAFGSDLQSSVIQLGKALNDPAGMGAMKRIGVSFTDAQIAMGRELFETGQIAEYQKLVMSELNTEVGGMARAMGTTYAGQVAILKNELGELGESAGNVLLPWLTGAASGANILINRMDHLRDSNSKWGSQLRTQGSNYTDYVKKVIANADAVGALHYSQERYLNMIAKGKELPAELADKIGLLSEREYELMLTLEKSSGAIEENARQWGSLGVDIDDSVIPVLEETEDAFDDAAEAVDGLGTKIRSLNDINPSFGSDIKNELEKLDFLKSGGDIWQGITDQIKDAWEAGTITDAEAQSMFEQAYLGAAAVELRMGEEKDEVIKNIMETFGATHDEASILIDNFIAEESKKVIQIQVELITSGMSSDVAALIENQTYSGGSGYYSGGGQAGGGLGGGMTLVGERGPEVVDLPAGARVHNHLESQGGGGMSQSDMSTMAKLFAVAVKTELQKVSG